MHRNFSWNTQKKCISLSDIDASVRLKINANETGHEDKLDSSGLAKHAAVKVL
jgi:hypothetical protein